MNDLTCEDRRIDAINTLQVKVAVLEAAHNDDVRTRAIHEANLDNLSIQYATMSVSLGNIIVKFDEKFDALMDQFRLGFKVASAFCAIIVVAVGAFWGYSSSLESKFSPKIDQLVSSALSQQSTNQENINKLLSVIESNIRKN